MRKRIGILVLVIAVGILGWIWGDRRGKYDQLMKQAYVALYYARIGVLDGNSKRPIKFDVQWPDDVTPSVKGSGPAKIIEHLDLSQSVVLVGYNFKDGLPIKIIGHIPQTILLKPQEGGVDTMPDDLVTVTLAPILESEPQR